MVIVILAGVASPARASDDPLERPIFWPTVRFGWPERLSAGGTLQPRIPGVLNKLVLGGTIGRGGYKLEAGYGAFGGNVMAGTALVATMLRTTSNPRHADPDQTYVGIEGHFMVGNVGFRAGPAFRVGGRRPSTDRVRLNFSVGLGF